MEPRKAASKEPRSEALRERPTGPVNEHCLPLEEVVSRLSLGRVEEEVAPFSPEGEDRQRGGTT